MTSVKHQDYLPADVADLCEKLCAASLQARPGGIRDSLRREASQAAGAAPTLRYGPAGDSAPRLRLRRLVWPKAGFRRTAPNMNDNILYHA